MDSTVLLNGKKIKVHLIDATSSQRHTDFFKADLIVDVDRGRVIKNRFGPSNDTKHIELIRKEK